MSEVGQRLPDVQRYEMRSELEMLVLGIAARPEGPGRQPKGVLHRNTRLCPVLNSHVRGLAGESVNWQDIYTWNLIANFLRGVDDGEVEDKRGLVAAKHLLGLAEDYPDNYPIPGTEFVLSTVYRDVGNIKQRIFKERVAIRRAFVARMYGQKSYGVVEPGSAYSTEIAKHLLEALLEHIRVSNLATIASTFEKQEKIAQTSTNLVELSDAGQRSSIADERERVGRPKLSSSTGRLFAQSERYVADITTNQGDYVKRGIESEVLAWLRKDSLGLVGAVVGEAGTGKSTLLSELRRKVLALPDQSVVLLAAEWLFGKASGVSTEGVIAAVDDALAAGTTPKLFIDTADLLLRDEDSRRSLHALLDEMELRQVAVIIATRPRELEYLRRSGLQKFILGPYSPEELEVAVPMLAGRYCREGDQAITLAEVLEASSRRLPVVEVCHNPLLVRLLFELANGDAPELREADVTSLYKDYWDRRVVRDARKHDVFKGLDDQEADLSALAGFLGIAFLSAGAVELAEDAVCAILSEMSPSRTTHLDGSVESQIEILVKRGVLVRTGEAIKFFHQTMLEYAAAKGLQSNMPADGIVRFAELAGVDGPDFFLGAVLEQLLVLSGANPMPRPLMLMQQAVHVLLSSASVGMQEIALVAWAHVPRLIPDPSMVFSAIHPSAFSRSILTIPTVASGNFVTISEQLDALLSIEDGRVYTLVAGVLTRLAARMPEEIADFVASRPQLSTPPSYAHGDEVSLALAGVYFDLAKFDSRNVGVFLRLLRSRTLFGSPANPLRVQLFRRASQELKFWVAPDAMRELSGWPISDTAHQLASELAELSARWYLKCTDVSSAAGEDDVLALFASVPEYQYGKQRILDGSRYYGSRECEWSSPRQLLLQIRTTLHILSALPSGSAALELGLSRLIGLVDEADVALLPENDHSVNADPPTVTRFLIEEGFPNFLSTGSPASSRCQELLIEAARIKNSSEHKRAGFSRDAVLAIARQPATPLDVIANILPVDIEDDDWLSAPEMVATLPAAAACGYGSACRVVQLISEQPRSLSTDFMNLLVDKSLVQIHRGPTLVALVLELAIELRRDDAVRALPILEESSAARVSLQSLLPDRMAAVVMSDSADGEDENASVIDAILSRRFVSLSWHELRGMLNRARGSAMISALVMAVERLPERSGPNDLQQQLSYLYKFIRVAPDGKAKIDATERGRTLSSDAMEACRRAWLHLLVWRGKPTTDVWPQILSLSSSTVDGKFVSASAWEVSAASTYLTKLFDAGARLAAKEHLIDYLDRISTGTFDSHGLPTSWDGELRSAIRRALRVDTREAIARCIDTAQRIDTELARVILNTVAEQHYLLARPHFAEALRSEDIVPETRREFNEVMRFYDRQGGGRVYPALLEMLS